MTNPHPRILVVDDEPHQLDTVCRGLRLYGYRCRGVASVEAALEALDARDGDGYDLVLTDLTLPGRSGIDLVEHLVRNRPGLPIVVITGLAAPAEVGVLRGARLPVLPKPFEPDTLDSTLRLALGRS